MKNALENEFAEVLYILNKIEKEYKAKIPKDLMQVFYNGCNKKYLNKLIKENNNIENINYLETTLTIIAYLNLKYWCETSKEKNSFKKLYINNCM